MPKNLQYESGMANVQNALGQGNRAILTCVCIYDSKKTYRKVIVLFVKNVLN